MLAAREKFFEVVEQFAGISKALEMIQFEFNDVPSQKDPVVHVFEREQIGISGLQNFLEAEFMERAEPHALGALADGLYHTALHFSGGFICEREPQDIFTCKLRIRFEQVTDALGDHASLAGSGPRDHQEGAFTVFDGSALLGVELEARF